AQSDSQIILAIIIFLVLGFFILSRFLDQQCKSCGDKKLIKRYKDWRSQQDSRNRREGFSERPGPPTHIGPTRMDRIYDSQDYYNSHPFIYPTPNSFVTSQFAIKRDLRERGVIYE
ncbi:hypothetical protein DRO61_09475, partial [Candidatus Bathyarchaeota archaeon]